MFALGDSFGAAYRLYECAHPEAVTMPRRWPQADRIRVLGAIDPPPVNGVMRGVALAVQSGQISMDQAIDFVNDVMTDKTGSPAVWRHALSGLWGMIRRREIGAGEVLKYLAAAALRKHPDYRGITYVRVTGKRNGEQVVSIRRVPVSGPRTNLASMAAATGAATAAFMVLALEEIGQRSGVLAPEDWANPEKFYEVLARVGHAQLPAIIESVVVRAPQ